MKPQDQAWLTENTLVEELDVPSGTAVFVSACVARITQAGAGTKYYKEDTDKMLFETMPMADLLTYTEEEILDIPNYAVMLFARGVPPIVLRPLVEAAAQAYRRLEAIRESVKVVPWADTAFAQDSF